MHTGQQEEQAVDMQRCRGFARSRSGGNCARIAVAARTPPEPASDRTHTAAGHSHTVDTEGHCFGHGTAH